MCDSKMCPTKPCQDHRLLTLQEELEQLQAVADDPFATPPPLNTYDDMVMAGRQADRRFQLHLQSRGAAWYPDV